MRMRAGPGVGHVLKPGTPEHRKTPEHRNTGRAEKLQNTELKMTVLSCFSVTDCYDIAWHAVRA